MAYPISHGRYINLAVFETDYSREGTFFTDPWIATVDSREISRSFENWETDVRQIIHVSLRFLFTSYLSGPAIPLLFTPV